MVKKNKKLISLLLAAGLALGLVGCGSSSSDSGKKEDKNQIVFWSVFTGPDGENMNKIVDAYNKTNPEVPVKHIAIEANDMYTKIPTTVTSGKDVPNLTIVHAERVPQFVEDEVVMPLDKYLESNGNIKKEEYVEQAWNVGSINDSQYSIPLDVHSFVTYYNKDLLEKYGPKVLDDNIITIEEVIEVGKASQKDGVTSMGVTWLRVMYLSWLKQLGGDISKDGVTPDINTPEGQKILTDLAELVNTKVASQDGDDPGQLFRSGQMVFWPEGIWMQNSLKDITDLNWGMTHHIAYDANKLMNWSSSHQFVMLNNKNTTDEKAEAVMKFVDWVADNSLEWANAGQVPAALTLRDSEEFKKLPQSFLLNATDTIGLYNFKYYGYAVESLDKVVFEAAFSRMTADEALGQAQKETEDRIKMGNN